jgi:hypothetical protein
MARSLSAATLLLLTAAVACADTYVTGDISVDTTWTLYGSPYIIQSDVNIINNSTLTLNGGTEVRFDGYFELVVDHGSDIHVEGDAVNTVLITSNDPGPGMSSWKWIKVQGDQQSSFQYCTIEYANTGVWMALANPAPWLYYCTIHDCAKGIFCSSTSPTVEMCSIRECFDAVWIDGNASDPAITYNDICNNLGWNIYVMSYPEPARTINCQHNWWGTDIEGEIQHHIRDSVSNPGEIYATIDFSNWLTE